MMSVMFISKQHQAVVEASIGVPVEGAVREVKPARRGTIASRMTVVLPVFNEQQTLPTTLETLVAFADQEPACRFVLVNDGSSDETDRLLSGRLGAAGVEGAFERGVGYVSYVENRGKGHAIKTAMELLPGADDELVVFMDGDMAYGLDHLPELERALAAFDVVIGSRRESPEVRRNTKKLRRLLGWGFNKMVQVGMGLRFKDTQAGLKGFRLGAAREIFPRVRLKGFAFDVEALFIAKKRGFTIGEVPARVARSHRKKASNVNLTLEPVKMAGDLARIRWNWLLRRYR